MLKGIVVYFLLCVVAFSGSCLTHRPISAHSNRRLTNTAALLEIHGPLNWLPESNIDHIKVTLSSAIEQGQDFFLWISPFRLPAQTYTTLYLQLFAGKRWVPHLQHNSTETLRLLSIVCTRSNSTSRSFPSLFLATVVGVDMTCPRNISLPGASIRLQLFLNQVLADCQAPLIISSQNLKRRQHQYSSLQLLMMQPAVLLVSGVDQSLEVAAAAVDAFLASHAVMTVAWEPFHAEVNEGLSIYLHCINC